MLGNTVIYSARYTSIQFTMHCTVAIIMIKSRNKKTPVITAGAFDTSALLDFNGEFDVHRIRPFVRIVNPQPLISKMLFRKRNIFSIQGNFYGEFQKFRNSIGFIIESL